MFTGLYAKLIAGAVLLAIVVGTWAYIGHLRSENTSLTVQVQTLNTQLKAQNDAIDQMKLDADNRAKAAAIAIAEAEAAASKNKSSAKIIYRTLPSTPGKDCASDRKSALDLVNGGVK